MFPCGEVSSSPGATARGDSDPRIGPGAASGAYNPAMQIGSCTACGRPFTAGEVLGLGILRSRPASEGGPRMEFTCPGCAKQLRLIPHGLGRYAFPGAPLPPPVPAAERVPPWVDREQARAAERVAAPPPPPPGPAPPPPPRPAEPTPAAPEEAEPPLTVPLALEILGVEATAGRGDLERAFRNRSRTCHPDKVAHLDAEFQALAERKFKRLKGAFDLLTG